MAEIEWWHWTVTSPIDTQQYPFRAMLSNIRQIQWWRPTASFIKECAFATCISLSVSRLGLTGEERDQVTLMHHGCWRTHMHTPRNPLSHPISLSHFLSHTPLWADTLVRLWSTTAALCYCTLATCEQSAVWKSLVSKNKLKPCRIAKGLLRVSSGRTVQSIWPQCYEIDPALNCNKIDCWQKS